MRLAVAILIVTFGAVAAVWLHGLRHDVLEKVPDPAAPGLEPAYTVTHFSQRYSWDDSVAIAALGVALAAAAVVGRTKAAPAGEGEGGL